MEKNSQILQKVLAKIKPSVPEQKKFSVTTAAFLKKIHTQLRDAKAILGGSGARSTWLAGNHDVDVFVAYDYKKYREQSQRLSEFLEAALKKAFARKSIERLHGSRDYFQLRHEGVIFEVIPILQIINAEEAKNITDVSPLHAQWVNEKTTSLKEDILLAKQFCRTQQCYGAESHIGGLSGYVLEILIVVSGSFENFLRAVVRWGLQDVVDPTGYYRGKDVMFALNKSKLQSPLIVIDPVDKNRNAAAAFTEEKFYRLKEAAREYLRKPSEEFFFKKNSDWEVEAKKRRCNLVDIEVEPLRGKKDVVGVKLGKSFAFLKKKLAPFGVEQAHWDWGEYVFFLEKRELPLVEEKQGPPLELAEHVKQFKKAHKETFVKGGRVWARSTVKFPKLEDFVKAVLKEGYVLEKVKKVRKVKVV